MMLGQGSDYAIKLGVSRALRYRSAKPHSRINNAHNEYYEKRRAMNLGPSGQNSDAVVVHFQLQTIKSRPHILRETRRKLLVIQRDVQIGQDSALGIHATNLTQSI